MYEVEMMNFLNEMYANLDEDKGVELNDSDFTQLIHTLGEETFERAQEDTPIKTGNLLSSIYINYTDDGFKIGYTAEYAGYVHEIMAYHHIQGKAKFLWDAFTSTLITYLIGIDRADMPDFTVLFSVEPLFIEVHKGGAGQLWRTIL